MGLRLPPTGTDFRRGEPPETSPKGSFLNRLYARRVQVSTKRGKAVENNLRMEEKPVGFVRTIAGSVGRYLARRRRIRALRSRYRYLYRSGKR